MALVPCEDHLNFDVYGAEDEPVENAEIPEEIKALEEPSSVFTSAKGRAQWDEFVNSSAVAARALVQVEQAEEDPWADGEDAWSDHLVLQGAQRPSSPPCSSGKPVLMMAPGMVEQDQEASGAHPQPKPAEVSAGKLSLSEFADKFRTSSLASPNSLLSTPASSQESLSGLASARQWPGGSRRLQTRRYPAHGPRTR